MTCIMRALTHHDVSLAARPGRHQCPGGEHHDGGREVAAPVSRGSRAHPGEARGDGAVVERTAQQGHPAQGQTHHGREPADVLQRLQRTHVSLPAVLCGDGVVRVTLM